MHEITKNVMAMEYTERYRFFIEKIVDDGHVWILGDDEHVVVLESDNGKQYTPAWPLLEMAEDNLEGIPEGCEPRCISLSDFMTSVVDKAISTGNGVAPNYDAASGDDDCLFQRSLRNDINREIKKKKKWYRNYERINDTSDEKADFKDFEKLLTKFNKSFRSKTDKDFYFYGPPYWMTENDPLRLYFGNEDAIIKESGRIVYGYVWKCDDDLFDRYPREDRIALVLYSEDPQYAKTPNELRKIGDRIDKLKHADIMPEKYRPLMDEIYSDDPRILNKTLPEDIAGEKNIILTTIVVNKKFLDERMLFRRIVPLAIYPERCSTSAIMPDIQWPIKFTLYYTSFNEVDMADKMEPVQSKETIQEIEKILKMGEEEKYFYFIQKVCRSRNVWFLAENHIPALMTGEGSELYLFWSDEDLAEMNTTGEFSDCTATDIDIYEFIAKWMPNLDKQGSEVMLYYYTGDNRASVEVDPLKLHDDLEKEMLKQAAHRHNLFNEDDNSELAEFIDQFIKIIVEKREIWALDDGEGFITFEDQDGISFIFIFSTEKEALDSINENQEDMEGFEPHVFKIDEFINEFIPFSINWDVQKAIIHSSDEYFPIDLMLFREILEYAYTEIKGELGHPQNTRKHDMDFSSELEEMRMNYSSDNKKQFTLIRPEWLDDSWEQSKIFKELNGLKVYGQIVYSSYITAHPRILESGEDSLPGTVIYSFDPWYNSNPYDLVRLTYEISSYFDVNELLIPDDLKNLIRKMDLDPPQTSPKSLPHSITEGKDVYCRNILFQRDHLPGGQLYGDIFPILADPDHNDSVMVLPRNYWSHNLTKIFLDDYTPKEVFRKNEETNEIMRTEILDKNNDEQYAFFMAKAIGTEEIWTLKDEDFIVFDDENGQKWLPIWPEEEFTDKIAPGLFGKAEAYLMDIYEFSIYYTNKFANSGWKAAVMWNDNKFIEKDFQQLKTDLGKEMLKDFEW